jgi:hypothetical protein
MSARIITIKIVLLDIVPADIPGLVGTDECHGVDIEEAAGDMEGNVDELLEHRVVVTMIVTRVVL